VLSLGNEETDHSEMRSIFLNEIVMKLLLDTGDGDEDMVPESTHNNNNIGYGSNSQSPNATPLLHKNDPLEQALFDGRVGLQHHLSHDPVSPMGGHPHGQDSYGYSEPSPYYRPQQQQFHGSSSALLDSGMTSSGDHLYEDQTSVTTPDSAISLSSQHSVRDPTAFANMEPLTGESLHHHLPETSGAHTPIIRQKDFFRSLPPPPHQYSHQQHSHHPSCPLWPTTFRLFTQYLSAGNNSINSKHNAHHFNHGSQYGASPQTPESPTIQIHDLARLQDLNQSTFGNIDIHHLATEKFPHLIDLYRKVACEFLLFKIHMDLDLELEGGTFENSCLFESNDPHRTLRCSTLIYSFGAKVLESTEIKPPAIGSSAVTASATVAGAAGISGAMTGSGGKCSVGFQFVNQFFTAFLSGIRTLGTLDEVQVALSNLSIVQIYEEIDPVAVSTAGAAGGVVGGGSGGEGNCGSPLLVMAFEFQQGTGSVMPYFVTEGSDMLDSLMC